MKAYLFVGDKLMTHRIQMGNALGVFAQINLHANKELWYCLAKMRNLGQPLKKEEKMSKNHFN